MADFTLSSGSIMRPYRSPWGAFPTRTMQAISTATIKLGQLLTTGGLGTTNAHRVQPIISTGGLAATDIVGIAAEAWTFTSSATTPASITVWEANPAVEFRVVALGAVLASSNVGQRKALGYDSAKDHLWVNLGTSTATDHRVVITGLIDAAGDSGGAVSVRFLTHLGDQVASTVMSSSPLLAFYS